MLEINIVQRHHLVTPSPWPLIIALIISRILSRTVVFFKLHSLLPRITSFLLCGIISTLWWRDVIREGVIEGAHSLRVQRLLKFGFLLFIITEVLFFGGFFWGFFHNSLSPSPDLGRTWPGVGIRLLRPFQVPLLNTIILLRRGVTITLAHNKLVIKEYSNIMLFILATIILGRYFTILQAWEYYNTNYRITDRVCGTTFFLLTGFHGAHVIIGTVFLIVSALRTLINQFTPIHHLGIEISIWYWHFVDVVWLFLWTFVYWWSY